MCEYNITLSDANGLIFKQISTLRQVFIKEGTRSIVHMVIKNRPPWISSLNGGDIFTRQTGRQKTITVYIRHTQ